PLGPVAKCSRFRKGLTPRRPARPAAAPPRRIPWRYIVNPAVPALVGRTSSWPLLCCWACAAAPAVRINRQLQRCPPPQSIRTDLGRPRASGVGYLNRGPAPQRLSPIRGLG